MSLLLAFALAAAAEPRGLSLREAQTLPVPAVAERALGTLGVLYTEVERPSPAIRRGTGFTLRLATAPRSAGEPGLCMAETITVYLGPARDGPTTMPVRAQSFHTGRVYRIVGDTAPPADIQDENYWNMLRAQCAAAGPVFSAPGVAAPRFFSGSVRDGGFSAGHAWFAARVLATASSAAASGALPVTCRDFRSPPPDPVCGDPTALLRNLPMERLRGFWIERCAPRTQDLCVTANFSRTREPGPSTIGITIRTGLSEVRYSPNPIPLREIQVQDVTPIP